MIMNTYEEFLAKYSEPPKKDFLKLSVEDRTAVIYNQVVKEIARLRNLGKLSPEQNLDPMGIVAQILVETGNGTSDLVKQANNFGGIVADKGWKGPKSPSGRYRSYATPEEGLRAQVEFYVENPRYAKAGVLNAKNALEHLTATSKAGYAENPEKYLETTSKTLKSIPNRLAKADKELLKDFEFSEENEDFNSENINFKPQTFTIKQSGAHDPLLLENPVMPNYDLNNNVSPDIDLLETPLEVPPPAETPMYKNGGTMNFKSKAAYKNYLGYIYANNLNKPGGAPVTIKGKHHEVDRGDQFGGYLLPNGGLMYGNGEFAMGPAFAMGGPFNNPGFKALPKQVQAKIKANSFAEGGDINQLTEFNAGGTHEENPLGGIPQGMAPDGQPNLVEQGETKLNAKDYIFSDRLKIDKQIAEEFNLPKNYIGKTFAEASKKTDRPDSRRENDTIELNAKEKELNILMEAQEAFKAKEVAKKMEEINSLDPTALQGMGQPQIPQSISPMGMPQGQPVDPSQIPPEILAQMPAAQQGAPIMAMGGHIYMCGGHRYDFGNFLNKNPWIRDVGAGMYGAGEGLLDTLSMGLTDDLTDKGYTALQKVGGGDKLSKEEIEEQNSIRGFGNTAGAITGAVLNPASLGSAISEGSEGLGAGISNIKGTDAKTDAWVNGIAQVGSIAGGFVGGGSGTGALTGSKGAEFLGKMGSNPMMKMGLQQGTNLLGSIGTSTNNAPQQTQGLTPEQIAQQQEEQRKLQHNNQMAGLYSQYGNINPNNYQGYMANGGHMYDGNPSSSSWLWNNQSGSTLPTNPYTSNDPTLGLTIDTNQPNNFNTDFVSGSTFSINNNSGNKSPYDTDLSDVDNYQNIVGSPLMALGTLGSVGYNAYMALKKPKTYSAADFYTAPKGEIATPQKLGSVKFERMNYTPALQSAERTTSAALMAARKGGDTGTYLNMLNTLRGGYGEQAGNIAMQERNANAAISKEEALANKNAEQFNIQSKYQADAANKQLQLQIAAEQAKANQLAQEANWRTQAARQEATKAIFSDLFNLGQVATANQLGSSYANMQAPKGQGINYTPFLQSLFSKNNG